MATEDRRPYLSATSLDQDLLDQMADNLEFGVEMVADIETPTDTIYASDRNKYVGGRFYQAICQFPTIKRTIGEWLSPTIEFSTLELPLSNVDGRFNSLLPGGADFDGWIGKTVDIRLGIRDAGGTYSSIYKGRVTDIGGLSRDRMKITVRTRDQMDKLSQNFPNTAITQTGWADVEDGISGTILPVIYGDWTVAPLQETPNPPAAPLLTASVPAFVVNGKLATVLSGVTNVRLLVSENANADFDTSNVWLKRSDAWTVVPGANVAALSADKNDFQIVQGFTVAAAPYVYQTGDLFYVRVKGKDLSGYSDNIVWQGRDILIFHGGADVSDFDASWATVRDKAAPAESAIAAIKSRVWIQEPENAVTYVLSMFEQVRVEMFVDKSLKLKLAALHLDEFQPAPDFVVKQWDVVDATLAPKLDDRNIWNRAKGDYAYDPVLQENSRGTSIFRNQAAIDQIGGREISKKVVFPNLYVEGDVVANLKEMLRLASGYPEFVEMTLTPRAMLLDIGDFVRLRISMGSVVFDDVPALIREIGYDQKGSIPVKLWSMQMTPFPGWTPAYGGIVGGSTATITEET